MGRAQPTPIVRPMLAALAFAIATQVVATPPRTRFVILSAEQGLLTVTVRASAINFGDTPEAGWKVSCQALGVGDADLGRFESGAIRLPRVTDTIANMKDVTVSGIVKAEGVLNLECRLVAPEPASAPAQ